MNANVSKNILILTSRKIFTDQQKIQIIHKDQFANQLRDELHTK